MGDGGTGGEVGDDDPAEPEPAVAPPATKTTRDRAWWLDRLAACTWIGLASSWTVVVVWALRVGESLQIVWLLTSGLHLLLLCGWIALAVGLALRRRPLAIIAAVTVVAQLAVAWPLLPIHGGGSHGRGVTIGSVNLYEGNPDLDAAARTIANDPPAILVIQEYTLLGRAAFKRVGLVRHYRHKFELPDPATSGTAVYSQYPFTVVRSSVDEPAALTVSVDLPSGKRLTIFDVHVFPPQPGDAAAWHRDMGRLGRMLDTERGGRWIAIGDDNATADHRPFRDLLHGGRRDAHALTGRGYARSWPANKLLPPMVLIDHAILSPGVGASGTRERTIPGTDHRMIEVDVTT